MFSVQLLTLMDLWTTRRSFVFAVIFCLIAFIIILISAVTINTTVIVSSDVVNDVDDEVPLYLIDFDYVNITIVAYVHYEMEQCTAVEMRMAWVIFVSH